MPKVSIVIPSYNHGRFLARRLESVLGQTFQDIELILLDDASTDGSQNILRHYEKDPRVRLCFNAVNSGSPFKQWNKGVSLAQAQYVWIAESDDWAQPTLLEKLVPLLEQNPSLGLAYCRSRLVDENNQPLGFADRYVDHLAPGRWAVDFRNNGLDENQRFLYLANTVPNASAVVFRRSAYLAAGMAPENFRLVGDWRLWFDLLLRSDLAYVAEPMNHFRTHCQTVRQTSESMGLRITEECELMRYMRSRLQVSDEQTRLRFQELAQVWLAIVRKHRRMPSKVRRELIARITELDRASLPAMTVALNRAIYRGWMDTVRDQITAMLTVPSAWPVLGPVSRNYLSRLKR